jgi:hypothetical protein
MSKKYLPKNNNREQVEQKLMDRFIVLSSNISTDARNDRQNAKTTAHNPHMISEVEKIREKLDSDSRRAINLADDMEQKRKDMRSSFAFQDFLSQEIAKMTEEEVLLSNVYELVYKSEKCGDKELAEIAKEKEFWSTTTLALLIASAGIAATMAIAPSGQELCLSILSGLVGVTALAASKAAVVYCQHKSLGRSVDDKDYICNDGPQRPGAGRSVLEFFGKKEKRKQLIASKRL